MLTYVNGFSCAVDSENFIINFVQRNPKIEAEGIQDEMVVESVASLVMSKAAAGRLLDALQEMLDVEIEDEESE